MSKPRRNRFGGSRESIALSAGTRAGGVGTPITNSASDGIYLTKQGFLHFVDSSKTTLQPTKSSFYHTPYSLIMEILF